MPSDASSPPPDQPDLGPRDLDGDAVAMRALAHPTRLRLLEELTLRGPLTATEASGYVGESPSSCSFHLRTLARSGFVVEAEGGTGRQRPWRAVTVGNRWRTGPSADAGTQAAGETLGAQVRRRDAELLAEHLAHSDQLPVEWADAVIHSNFGGWLTADELAGIGATLLAAWAPYLERLRDPAQRPPGSRLVHMFAHGFPRADHAPTGHSDRAAETTGESTGRGATGDDDA